MHPCGKIWDPVEHDWAFDWEILHLGNKLQDEATDLGRSAWAKTLEVVWIFQEPQGSMRIEPDHDARLPVICRHDLQVLFDLIDDNECCICEGNKVTLVCIMDSWDDKGQRISNANGLGREPSTITNAHAIRSASRHWGRILKEAESQVVRCRDAVLCSNGGLLSNMTVPPADHSARMDDLEVHCRLGRRRLACVVAGEHVMAELVVVKS